jgi:predicted Zn-dependent peptidase
MKKLFLVAFAIIIATGINAQNKYEWKSTTSAGYNYKYVTNDPMHARFYTLKNGLTVILSDNPKEPRVAVRIAVRTGSNNDPGNHTGLAHYLEHLLFKGTDKFGSLDWAKEKPYLDNIDALYEQYNSTKDVEERRKIYRTIDSTSGIASKYAIANEYDKLMKDLGSQSSNAHTWVEETVYEEDIPANAMDKFLTIQAERFRNPIFRLFHTELEAVYEEKNRGLDNDGSKMQEAMMYYLFPTSNYGQQTTIGTIEDLKNPSLLAIRDYYHKYYVPNNMAIIMAGDINADELIKKIDKQFSYMKEKPVTPYDPAPEKPITQPIVKDIYGPSAENMRLCYRTPADNTRDALVLNLIGGILSNGSAGLLDLDLNSKQKVQQSYAGLQQYKDYGIFIVAGTPRQGQTLEEVKGLLMAEIDKLKKGKFDESLVKAIAANNKLGELQGLESDVTRAEAIMSSFIKNKGYLWNKDVASTDDQSKISKQEIISVANKYFANNYVLLYKKIGKDTNIVKVDKPPITPVETNAGKQSPFVTSMIETAVSPIKPVWLNFEKDISKGQVGIAPVLYVQNKDNELFRLYYRFDMGSWNNKLLPIASDYLQYLGTNKYSSEDISKKFYDIACSFNLNVGTEETTVSISGLQQNFDKAVSLFEELIAHCKPDTTALASLKEGIFKNRANTKLNKGGIMSGLVSYALYGINNPFNNVLSEKEITDIKAEDLVKQLHGLMNYRHTVIYYGPASLNNLTADVKRLHSLPQSFTAYPAEIKFVSVATEKNQVLFADYDMVQSEIRWVRNGSAYNPDMELTNNLFNSYFGGGMGSVVFQTIRESKALAYSTFAVASLPAKKEDPVRVIAYVGSQADKANDAVKGMNELLETMPRSEDGFEVAKQSFKKELQTSRITQDDIIFTSLAAAKKGISYDIREKEYGQLDAIKFDDINKFYQLEVGKKPFVYCVVASEKKIDLNSFEKLGDVKKLTLKEIFGY